MQLTKLFEMQKVLDDRIEKEHPREEIEFRFPKKILSLQVELGELANEWRGFKFWSTRQIPTEPREETKWVDGRCYVIIKNPLLEEYVDCLHFILSIGLEIGKSDVVYFNDHIYKEENTTNQFLLTFNFANGMNEDDYFTELLHSFVYLGETLGFSWDQIEQAYINKNEINHIRQESGY